MNTIRANLDKVFSWLVFLTAFFWTPSSLAASIALVRTPGEHSQTIQAIEFVTHSYDIKLIDLPALPEGLPAIPSPANLRGIIITANVLRLAHVSDDIKEQLESRRFKSVPILLVDMTPQDLSGLWSEEELSIAALPDTHPLEFISKIVGPDAIAKELAGLSFCCDQRTKEAAYYFNKLPKHNVEVVVELGIPRSAKDYPIFFKSSIRKRDIFSLTKVPIAANANKEIAESIATNFITYAPIAMFVRYAAGQYVWHSDAYYANLTIDDPWLTEPYGNLSYYGILNEMKKNTFHTTIAFVPWNFDRSDASLVNLFKHNPDRLSLTVHGNNHDHEEFAEDRPLEIHEKNIRQGLARMEEFKKRTGLEYDKAMVFPHRVASPQVIGLLRKYGFDCTANLQNRRHSSGSSRPGHLWGDFVAEEQGIPSLKRELPNTTEEHLAILLFLHIPILLHTHQDYFATGIEAFSKTANVLSHLRPDIRWVGLGSLCENLYLKKLEDDGAYRILLFGSRTIVKNADQVPQRFVMEKAHPTRANIRDVRVNGKKVAFRNVEHRIQFEVTIDGMANALISVRYEDEVHGIRSVDTQKSDLWIWALRYVSDFRDIVMAQTALGRSLTKAYYARLNANYTAVDRMILWGAFAIPGLMLTFTAVSLRRWTRRKRVACEKARQL